MGPLGHSLSALGALVAAPVLGAGALFWPRWRVGLRERLGARPESPDGAIWVHGASVGEIRAATRLIDALTEQGIPVVASTTTPSGRDLFRRVRPGIPCALAPVDHPWCTDRALKQVNPRALILVETELWPSLIASAHRAGVPVSIVSGRISERSFRRYARVGMLLRGTLARLACVGARSGVDAQRFVALGARPERVEVTGDLKLEPPVDPANLAPELESLIGEVPLFVAGSTHEGEEAAALTALVAAENAGLPLALVIAPRHLERAQAVANLCENAGRSVRRRSSPGTSPLAPGDVLLLDTLGELDGLYARAEVAFVGGTLAPVGGHNLLEPLQQGRPVIFGPYVENAAESASLALSTGAGFQVDDPAGLRECMIELLCNPNKTRTRARAARSVLAEHRGATARTLELLEPLLGGTLLSAG
ncbi:MAG: 3-deoxy-D-manno-octulosonic acid transferase [Myxococcota bacterium]|nr:3-deoxy-D-manno-octulosonic acid transferase [Myxococcota bacterium]